MSEFTKTILALDAHGGDRGLDVSVPAALAALEQDLRLQLILVGDRDAIGRALEKADVSAVLAGRLDTHHAERVIPMDARPAHVLRHGRGSSMWKAFELVADGEAQACISGGGTAAMMVAGVKVLGMLDGIQRPALMGWLPNNREFTGMLDLGANINVSADQLVQFAVMGSVTAMQAEGIENPRVGLLNVGHEESKGGALVRRAHERLQELPLNYRGFIEGHDIFAGTVDIAVCDGFAGNLVLKSTEGLARMMLKEFSAAFADSVASHAGELTAGPALKRTLARLDPSTHNGAPLLGLNRVAIKSHGSSDPGGMTRAILEAGREARRQVPGRIEALIHEYKLES
ncbi:MAG: phosphate acyltransferase PlsX [Xanthomonadales bacterium]|nr:phosphate acyltransferase PlsX [Xanthomonadales bacterium]